MTTDATLVHTVGGETAAEVVATSGEVTREMQERSARYYEIRVEGVLDEGWSVWFEPCEIRSEEGVATVISGPLTDQSALHGLLTKINDLGLNLISVRRIES